MTQNKTLTDEAFESALNACILDTECMLEYDEATTRDIGRFMWQAAKRETAQEIAELRRSLDMTVDANKTYSDMYADWTSSQEQITELQSQVNMLREALEESHNFIVVNYRQPYISTPVYEDSETWIKTGKALSATAQSLQAHDNSNKTMAGACGGQAGSFRALKGK